MLRCTEVLRPNAALGQTLPMDFAPLPPDVRCCSKSDHSRRECEMTRRAMSGLPGQVNSWLGALSNRIEFPAYSITSWVQFVIWRVFGAESPACSRCKRRDRSRNLRGAYPPPPVANPISLEFVYANT